MEPPYVLHTARHAMHKNSAARAASMADEVEVRHATNGLVICILYETISLLVNTHMHAQSSQKYLDRIGSCMLILFLVT